MSSLSRNSLEDTRSLSVTPHIHLTIILSALTSLCVSSTFIGHVSLPYNITLCTHDLYSLPFNFKETPFTVKMGDNSLNFCQAQFTLITEACPAPPVSLIMSPR